MHCRVSKYQINFEILILSWYIDIIMDCRISIYQINFELLRFWYYHDISMFKNKAMMDCRTSKYKINNGILILSYFIVIIKRSLIYLLYAIWYYQMPFDISFIFNIMVIFWYYHDISIFNNKTMMVAEYQNIKSTVRFWEFDIIMIFWCYQMIFDTSLVCHLAGIFWYYHDVLRFENRNHNNHKCVLPRSLIFYQTVVVYQKSLVL